MLCTYNTLYKVTLMEITIIKNNVCTAHSTVQIPARCTV